MKEDVSVRLPIASGIFEMKLFCDPKDQKEHVALVHGDISSLADVLIRIHSECLTGDVFGSLRCDCGTQLRNALDRIVAAGAGVLIYLRQEGRGIGLQEKLKAYRLQDEGHDTVEANLLLGHQADERDYSIAPHILKSLGVHSVRIITNNPDKIRALRDGGIQVVERVTAPLSVTKENLSYLRVKAEKMRHAIPLDEVFIAD